MKVNMDIEKVKWKLKQVNFVDIKLKGKNLEINFRKVKIIFRS